MADALDSLLDGMATPQGDALDSLLDVMGAAAPQPQAGTGVLDRLGRAIAGENTALGEVIEGFKTPGSRSARAPWEAPPLIDFSALGGSEIIPESSPKTKGAAEGVEEFATGLTSPVNALLGGGAVALRSSPVLQRLLSGGFAADMLHGALESNERFQQAVQEGNEREAARALVEFGGGAALGTIAGKHAVASPKVKSRPTGAAPEQRERFEVLERVERAPSQDLLDGVLDEIDPKLVRSEISTRQQRGEIPAEATAGERTNRAQRRASVMPPETGGPEERTVLIDPKLRQIVADLDLGEYEKLSPTEKATVRQLRDEGAKSAKLAEVVQPEIGLSPDLAKRMKRPVLVREIAEDVADPQSAITDFNKVGTAELRQAERAIADSRRVTPKTLDEITRRIDEQGPEGTLAKALDGDARNVVDRLTEDGVITTQERPRLMNGDGSLTAEGKSRVTRLLTGRLFEDARHFEETAPELRNKLERVVAPLARVEGRESWDISEATREAISLIEEARRRDQSIDDLISQRNMLRDHQYSADAVTIARKLQEKPTEVARAFRQYAKESDLANEESQGLLGIEPPDVADSLREAFRERDELGPVAREFEDKPHEALAWLRERKEGHARGVISHPTVGQIGLVYGKPGTPKVEFRDGFGVSHIDVKRPGYLDQVVDEIPQMPVVEEFRDKKGRVTAKILQKGTSRAVISSDWEGKAMPEWLLTAYERPAPGTSVGVSKAQPGAGPTPPATGRSANSRLDYAERKVKQRISKKIKDTGSTLSAGPGLAAELLADYAALGAIKIAKGAVKFSDWSREMMREYGEKIRPHLGKVWVRARKLHQEQVATEGGSGEKPPVPRTAAATAPEPQGEGGKPSNRVGKRVVERPRLTTSPSYDLTKNQVIAKVAPAVRSAMQERLSDFEQRNPERKAVTFAEIAEEARSLGLGEVASLSPEKLKAGDTLNPAVRFAARETLNGLNQEIQTRRKTLSQNTTTWDPAKREAEMRKLEDLETDAKRLIDVLIPTRSQDGRNLAYHRMMAQQSFDVTYWLSRAKRAMALPENVDLPSEVQKGIEAATAKGADAEAKAIEKLPRGKARRAAAEAEAKREVDQELGPAPKRGDRRTVDEKGNRIPTPAERQARYKQRVMEKLAKKMRGEDTKRAKSKWELTPEERAEVDSDPEVRVARIELARKMMRVERTGILDTISTLRRAGLLTGVRTHLRNLGGNTSFQVLEEVSRTPAAIVDSAFTLFGKQRTVEGFNARAIAKASSEAATRGIREAKQIMRDGATDDQLAQMDLLKELNSGSPWLDKYANTIFRSMSAADRVFKVYAFDRSLQEQMRLAKSGPTDAMRLKAWEDANFATFNNENIAARGWSSMKTNLRTKGTAGKALAFGMDLAVPFSRTPANIVARVIDYTPVGGVTRASVATARAVKNGGWTPEQQRAFSLAIGRGATGAALIYLGSWLASKGLLTGISEEERGRRAVEEAAGRMYGSFKIAGKWHRVDSFSPLGNLLVLGATLEREKDKGVEAVGKTAAATVMQQPMLQGTQEVVEAIRQPAGKAKSVAGSIAGSFIPTAVADVASLTDGKRRDTRGESITQAVGRGIAGRVPGLRNSLPPRVDVLGNELEQSWRAVLDPTIGSKDKTKENPVLRELVDNRVSSDFRRRGQDETEERYRLRIADEGQKIQTRLRWYIHTNEYRQTTTEEERANLLEAQIRKVRAAESRRRKNASQ